MKEVKTMDEREMRIITRKSGWSFRMDAEFFHRDETEKEMERERGKKGIYDVLVGTPFFALFLVLCVSFLQGLGLLAPNLNSLYQGF